MKAKVQKTILGKKVLSYEFYKTHVARLYGERVSGFINLDGARLKVEGSKIFQIDREGKKVGVVLNTTRAYKQIKRMIRIWFKYHRLNGNCQHVGYWRSRAIDGMHNVNLFRHSDVSFAENRSNFLVLAS